MNNQINRSQKIFSINSEERVGGSVSNFNIKVNMPLNANFTKCSLVRCEIPKSYYLIDSTNNVLEVYNASSVLVGNATFDIGTYTTATLATEMQTKIQLVFAGMLVTFNSKTGKFLFDGDGANFGLKVTSDPSLSKIIGLNYNELALSSGFELTPQNVVDLQRYDVIRIRSSIGLNNNDDILANIYPSTHPDFSVIEHETESLGGTSVSMSNANQNNFNFSLVDKDNKVINLNGVNWRCVISCWNE